MTSQSFAGTSNFKKGRPEIDHPLKKEKGDPKIAVSLFNSILWNGHNMTEFNVFLSYTSREEEVEKIKPLIDIYCRELWEWAQSKGIGIFYDDFTMQKRHYSDSELEQILGDAIEKSQLMTAFLSLEYVKSKWCQFEYLKTRETRKPPVHAIFWKWFSLGTAIIPYADYLSPEGHTDVMYLGENPSSEEWERAARKCVEDSIKLILGYYQI